MTQFSEFYYLLKLLKNKLECHLLKFGNKFSLYLYLNIPNYKID